jgi:hypothetical protein
MNFSIPTNEISPAQLNQSISELSSLLNTDPAVNAGHDAASEFKAKSAPEDARSSDSQRLVDPSIRLNTKDVKFEMASGAGADVPFTDSTQAFSAFAKTLEASQASGAGGGGGGTFGFAQGMLDNMAAEGQAMLKIQEASQKLSEVMALKSALQKAKHDALMGVIRNIA